MYNIVYHIAIIAVHSAIVQNFSTVLCNTPQFRTSCKVTLCRKRTGTRPDRQHAA